MGDDADAVAALIEHFCARHSAKPFIYPVSFCPHSVPCESGVFALFM